MCLCVNRGNENNAPTQFVNVLLFLRHMKIPNKCICTPYSLICWSVSAICALAASCWILFATWIGGNSSASGFTPNTKNNHSERMEGEKNEIISCEKSNLLRTITECWCCCCRWLWIKFTWRPIERILNAKNCNSFYLFSTIVTMSISLRTNGM